MNIIIIIYSYGVFVYGFPGYVEWTENQDIKKSCTAKPGNQNYFDWQTVGLMQSFRKAGKPGPITRLLSCTLDEKNYWGMG